MLSKYFKRSEFQCKCGCGYDTVDVSLLSVLSELRSFFGSPVHINSACRCKVHNDKIGGKLQSQHLYAKAADVTVKGHAPNEVANYLRWCYPDKYGIGEYDSFVHIDVRDNKARWKGDG